LETLEAYKHKKYPFDLNLRKHNQQMLNHKLSLEDSNKDLRSTIDKLAEKLKVMKLKSAEVSEESLVLLKAQEPVEQ
jgi:acetolactate synthase small subunit